jgi:TIR domain
VAHQIFLSYSTGDQAAADAICQALESSGIRCWIAPRDIEAGSGWGGSIVAGIRASQAVLVVFSEKSNASPQVVREMEVAVAQRLPLIPVRIADALPTEDMQYFLGVSHWFNAYPQPIATYLPQIVAMSHRVLAKESAPWRRFTRRLPQSRLTQYGMLGAAVLAAAVLTAWLMRPAPPPNPMDAIRSPIAGRWQAEIADAQGRKPPCVLDVQELGQTMFGDTCPLPLTGTRGTFLIAKDGTYAPQLFRVGKDTGSFMFLGGSIHGMVGVIRLEGRNRLVTNDAQRGEVTWSRIAADTPLHDASADILPVKPDWPLKDVPAIAARALAYARLHWQADAVLMDFKAELSENAVGSGIITPAGGLTVTFEFYSPSTQNGMWLMPNSPAGAMSSMGAVDRNPQRALPASFLDLPQAVATLQARGMRGKQIKMAELENWQAGTSYGSARLSGVEWMIDSSLDERGTVQAALR